MGQEGKQVMLTSIIGTSEVQGGFKIHRSRWSQGWNHWCFGVYIRPNMRHQLSFGFPDTFHPENYSSLANFDGQSILNIDMDERFQWIWVKCGNFSASVWCEVIHFWMEHANLWDSFRIIPFWHWKFVASWHHHLRYGHFQAGLELWFSILTYFAVFRDFDVISFGGQTLCQNMGIFADGL